MSPFELLPLSGVRRWRNAVACSSITHHGFRLLLLVGFAVLTSRLEAYPVPCGGTEPITFVSATVSASAAGATTDNEGNDGACTASANTQTPATDSSSTTGTFSDTALLFNFSDALDNTLGGGASGMGSAVFDAGSDVTYTITDLSPGGRGGDTYAVDATLIDETTGDTVIYDTASDPSNVTGQLTAGDVYEFTASANLYGQVPYAALYAPSIAFTSTSTSPVPEPQDLALVIPVLLGGFAALRRRLAR